MAPQFFPGCAPGGYLRNSSMIFNSRKSEKVYEKFKLKQKKSLQWLRMNANKDERRKTYSRISILGKILYLLINLWCKHLRYDIKSRTNFRWQSSYLCLIYNHTRDNFKYCQEIECSSIFRCWQGPDKGGSGGQCPGTALLVKRSNSNWSFTNEPEVRFRFQILVKVGPTIRPGLNICPGVPSLLAKCPKFHFSEFFKINSSLMMHCYEIIPFWKACSWGGRHFLTRPGAAHPHVGALAVGDTYSAKISFLRHWKQ